MEVSIYLITGLGLFFYGINIMGDGLQKIAGEELKFVIEKLSSNKFIGVLIGAIITTITQSSAATNIMTVGFVNTAIINLQQAVGIMLGTNIGTTVTAQLISFNIETIAPAIIGISMLVWIFTKKIKIKNMCEIFIGVGILFIGMYFMKSAALPISKSDTAKYLVSYLINYPVLGIIIGFILTSIFKSSTATLAILIAFASQNILPVYAALPIMYGDNIGGCVAPLMSTIGATKNAKRASIINLIFSIMGTVLFILVLHSPIVYISEKLNPGNLSRQIANIHTIFNLINIIILIPLSAYFIKLSTKIVPITDDEQSQQKIYMTKFLDERLLETPSIALSNVENEVIRMASRASRALNASYESIKSDSDENINSAFKYYSIISILEIDIINFLLALRKKKLSEQETLKLDVLFHIVTNIKRVGKNANDIAQRSMQIKKEKIDLSEEAKSELDEIFRFASKNFYDSITAIKTSDYELADIVIEREKQIDILEKKYKKLHLSRLYEGNCSVEKGIYFLDIVNSIKSVSDNAKSIAQELNRM
ncbi:Na/Pi cotransporter family protein [Peptostreptococcus faecalis]|uniref:Na/Pi cotransporter family protein n=1 Tax=Peptostreptococcus faecalis TaxID=2045015 RepID=UPI000C7E2183|nr:Na/Pi cotransporter family protein [Peptostreptococcus faecalis]